MAQVVNVIFTDDLDGAEGTDDDKVETRRWALGMNVFEADLRRTNWEQLKKALAPYTDIARSAPHEYRRAVAPVTSNSRNGTDVKPPQPRRTPKDRERAGEIREWAKTQPDIPPVSERGRIPRDVVKKFEEYEELRASL